MESYFGLVILACWVVFIAYWALSATKAKRTITRNYFGIGVTWRLGIVFILIVLVQVRPPSSFPSLIGMSPWWGVAGCVLAVAGIAIAVWARYYLGRNWGMPMSIKEDAELITAGPYAWVRNPIYTGVLLAMLGSAMVAGVWWFVIFFAGSGYFIFSLFQEEKQMQKEFPATYPAYKARTWRLIPFVF